MKVLMRDDGPDDMDGEAGPTTHFDTDTLLGPNAGCAILMSYIGERRVSSVDCYVISRGV